jgi:hypothetical protein
MADFPEKYRQTLYHDRETSLLMELILFYDNKATKGKKGTIVAMVSWN